MKLFKKIIIAIFFLFILSLFFGYFYFDRKFTPEENYLSLKNESGKIRIKWEDEDKSAMFIPINFENDTATYYLQFDTGSPYTLFYKNAIKNIPQISTKENIGKSIFKIGKTKIESDKFKIIDFGKEARNNEPKIIGTLGTDILEDRNTIINFRESYIEFNVNKMPSFFNEKNFDFNFKKRKVIISAKMDDKKQKFLYDSGTSSYELLTNKENWEKLKLKNSKIEIDKGNSWGNLLKTFTAKSKSEINFNDTKILLNEVTYVEGFSKAQYYLMKFSGMSGMLGNKIFLPNVIYIDCKEMKMAIE